jgi:hypothetical protein
VCHVFTGHYAADCRLPAGDDDGHEGTDPDEYAHPADRHTYAHGDDHPGSSDAHANPTDGDAPTRHTHRVRRWVRFHHHPGGPP